MPFTGDGPSYFDLDKTNTFLTIIPPPIITSETQVGTIYLPTETVIIKPNEITPDTTAKTDNVQMPGENVITDKVYDLLTTILVNFSNPSNIEQNALQTNVLPYIDELLAELDKYPNIFGLIMDIQQVFKNITNTIKNQTNLGTNNLRQVVLPQIYYLNTLIAQIPVTM